MDRIRDGQIRGTVKVFGPVLGIYSRPISEDYCRGFGMDLGEWHWGDFYKWGGGVFKKCSIWLGASGDRWGWEWCSARAWCRWTPWQLSLAHSGFCPGIYWDRIPIQYSRQEKIKVWTKVSATEWDSGGSISEVIEGTPGDGFKKTSIDMVMETWNRHSRRTRRTSEETDRFLHPKKYKALIRKKSLWVW